MMAMCVNKSVFLLLVSVLCLADGYTPGVYYFDTECSSGSTSTTLRISNDMRLKLSRSSFSLKRNWNCQLNIATSRLGDELLIQFRDFVTDYSSRCSENSLQILNQDHSPITGLICGHLTPLNDYETRGGMARFQFSTDNTIQYGQFDVLITSFTRGTNATCPGSRFHCTNGRCVNYAVTCNGYDDCGDDSDELRGCGLTVGALAGIVIAAIFVFTLVLIALIIVRRRRFKYSHFGGTVVQTSHPPPSYQTYGK
ncbi:low-density lipoprotein receptor-related protein 12-like [Gigantopelta aegis]|uniref:low-density lipoprotein receptor-related protein 12-like n=1 Tax=Gigantopelta aegis TaxID=1735272 RepID=UPI001B88B46A|nr:low-density lipoprotein receptor-related protein 12-like [Gigantopelta aegis]